MHYIGMAAIRSSAAIVYDWRIVALSIALAVAISLVAVQLAFRVREEQVLSSRKVISAVVMGSAIPLMHYTGMWAVTFRPSAITPDLTHSIGIPTISITSISASTLFVLGVVIASSFFDRLLALQKSALDTAQKRELYFHTMAEAVPEIIWTADPSGADDFFNRKCFDYTGLTFEQMRGSGWKEIVHSDDVQDTFAQWQKALRTGEPYEVEYRLRGKDGIFRWFLGRANPIRDTEGTIIKWFGTCTDIESNKKNEQILEQQILERTLQLADANERLQDEMSQKDSARQKLDQQNDSMMSELKKRSDRATMLAKMGELLQSCITREEVIAAALGFAPKIFPTARGAIMLLNSTRKVAEVIGSWTDCQLPAVEFESTECWALRTGHPHLVAGGDSTARCAHAAGVEGSYLCLPILAQGETLGILHLQMTADAPPLGAVELSFKTTFAGQVGLSMANIKLRDALRTQSVRDALTGLYNRRYLEETLDRELRRSARAQQSLGILMIDLDHFKNFNDSYGHDAGDAVLRETGASLTKGIRAEDFVCRFGGEEFVVILPTADLEAALARAESLRSKMRDLTILHQGKPMGMITISVGVAAFPEHGTSPKELMAAADAALYEAKHRGRDQVVAAAKVLEHVATPGAAKAAWS
jgi:diguanylate cyclase (GGDEF)-like protein/PAS domain S-box-containing protein